MNLNMKKEQVFKKDMDEFKEFINRNSFKELDEKPIENIKLRINNLEAFKEFLEKLYNENK